MSNIKFKSPSTEQKWIELNKQVAELKNKPTSPQNIDKLDIYISSMNICKQGFNLGEGKMKKIIKFLKNSTGFERVQYGILPEGIKPESIMFKDTAIIYAEREDKVVFREVDVEVKKKREPIISAPPKLIDF